MLSTYSCVVEAGMFAIGSLQLFNITLFEIIRKESGVVVIVGQLLF